MVAMEVKEEEEEEEIFEPLAIVSKEGRICKRALFYNKFVAN